MTEQPRTRQELYDMIRSRGKDQYVLEEMIRLGFWPKEGELPNDPGDEIRRMGKIRQELAQLRQENRQLRNEKLLRQQMFKERLAESRRKQQENKERRLRERQEKAEAWQRRKEKEILYLGEGVSGGLNETEGKVERLQERNLPILRTAEEVAQAMGVSVGELRFLAFDRKTAQISHYVQFKIPKKRGGERLISAPMPRLKQLQTWILRNILDRVEVHEAAMGFCCDRSILTNARPHVGAEVVINFDLQDFFPTITYRRVKGVFRALGYCEAVATILALLSSEADRQTVELDGNTYFVALGERHLPQGSPASPALSNILFRRIDRQLSAIAFEYDFTYTRYADDLTFSGSDHLKNIGKLCKKIRNTIAFEGFVINEAKTRVMRRKSSQMEVTGIVVNEFPNIDRKTLKKFRATLFQIEKDGLTRKTWGNRPDLLSAITGYAHFIHLVNPQKGAIFLDQIQRIREKWLDPQPKESPTPTETPPEATEMPQNGGIIVECYKQGSRLRVRVISPGYHADWNVQFPKELREEGAKYLVEEVKESKVGGFYRLSGNITKIVDG